MEGGEKWRGLVTVLQVDGVRLDPSGVIAAGIGHAFHRQVKSTRRTLLRATKWD